MKRLSLTIVFSLSFNFFSRSRKRNWLKRIARNRRSWRKGVSPHHTIVRWWTHEGRVSVITLRWMNRGDLEHQEVLKEHFLRSRLRYNVSKIIYIRFIKCAVALFVFICSAESHDSAIEGNEMKQNKYNRGGISFLFHSL